MRMAPTSSGFHARFLISSARVCPTNSPIFCAEIPIWGTLSIGLPAQSTSRSSTVISLRRFCLALATTALPSLTSGTQMMKPCACCAPRLSMAVNTSLPPGTPILISLNPFSRAACSANFHSSWNHGSSACLTRKPILGSSAACPPLPRRADRCKHHAQCSHPLVNLRCHLSLLLRCQISLFFPGPPPRGGQGRTASSQAPLLRQPDGPEASQAVLLVIGDGGHRRREEIVVCQQQAVRLAQRGLAGHDAAGFGTQA